MPRCDGEGVPPSPGMAQPSDDEDAIEVLDATARSVVWRLRAWVRSGARAPVFALLGSDTAARTQAALALSAAEGGRYVRLSENVRERVLADDGFRDEWITAGYLTEAVIDLARTCACPLLVVDDWQPVLGLVRGRDAGALAALLGALVYRPLPVPVVLVLGPGDGGYRSVDEVRRAMETEGRQRVALLDVGPDGREG